MSRHGIGIIRKRTDTAKAPTSTGWCWSFSLSNRRRNDPVGVSLLLSNFVAPNKLYGSRSLCQLNSTATATAYVY